MWSYVFEVCDLFPLHSTCNGLPGQTRNTGVNPFFVCVILRVSFPVCFVHRALERHTYGQMYNRYMPFNSKSGKLRARQQPSCEASAVGVSVRPFINSQIPSIGITHCAVQSINKTNLTVFVNIASQWFFGYKLSPRFKKKQGSCTNCYLA